MSNDLWGTTSRNKVAAVAYFMIASATVFSSQPVEAIERSNVSLEALTPEGELETVTDSHVACWVKFQDLCREWRQQSAAMSSVSAMCTLLPYQQIIGMGRQAIPFILTELRAEGDDPDQWFWALNILAQANNLTPPKIAPEIVGDYQAMAQVWLEWGTQLRYVG